MGRRGPAARRVVGLGLCVVDHLYLVEHHDPSDPRIRYSERHEAVGGMVGTALSQAARLGCETHVLTALGDDAKGRLVRDGLREAGVRTRRIAYQKDWPTTVAVVLVERRGGERRFLVADRRALERDAPDFDLDCIHARSVLLVDGHFSEQARRAVQRARAVGAPVVGDFSDPRPAYLRLLPYVDYPVVPQEFAEAYAGDSVEALRRLHEEFGGTPVVTQGRRGGIYLERGRVRRFRAPRVRVRDTTGAGDVFHGAFAAGLSLGLDLAGTIALAAQAASLCCTALGGNGRPMLRDELEAFLRPRAARPRAYSR